MAGFFIIMQSEEPTKVPIRHKLEERIRDDRTNKEECFPYNFLDRIKSLCLLSTQAITDRPDLKNGRSLEIQEIKTVTTPFIQRKLALAFCKHDLSKNGLLERKDFQLIGQTIAKSLGLKEDNSKYQQIVDSYTQAWDIAFAASAERSGGQLSLTQFLEALSQHYQSPTEKESQHRKTVDELVQKLFDGLDLDGNGTISITEYRLFLQAIGETNEENIKLAFETIDTNKDGTISRDEFVQIRLDYFMLDDPEHPSKWFYGSF